MPDNTTTNASTTSIFPPVTPNQTYVTVSPMAGGYITLPTHFFTNPTSPDEPPSRTVPSLSFLITHPGNGSPNTKPLPIPNPPPIPPSSTTTRPFHLLFDLGLRKHRDLYPAPLQTHLDNRQPHRLAPGIAAQLSSSGIDPTSDIDAILLSHVHYDHHGDPEDFPNARFIVGAGAMKVLKEGLGPSAPSHQHFDINIFPIDRTDELPPTKASASASGYESDSTHWKPLGPFAEALDLFSDGSVFVVDTPGHLPGHVNLLCRTRAAAGSAAGENGASGGRKKDRWIMLCGDSYHDRRLLTREKSIGTWEGPGGEIHCIHLDRDKAAASIACLGQLQRLAAESGEDVELVAAHEELWWEEARKQDREFPGTM